MYEPNCGALFIKTMTVLLSTWIVTAAGKFLACETLIRMEKSLVMKIVLWKLLLWPWALLSSLSIIYSAHHNSQSLPLLLCTMMSPPSPPYPTIHTHAANTVYHHLNSPITLLSRRARNDNTSTVGCDVTTIPISPPRLIIHNHTRNMNHNPP